MCFIIKHCVLGMGCSPECGVSSPPLVAGHLDCPIYRWQTRQMAKAVVDNTINKVLEGMGFTPLPHDAEDIFDDVMFNPPPVVAGNIEDEAVLMAIQHHGLQKPCTCSHIQHHHILSRQPFHHRPSPKVIPDPGPSDEHDFLAQAVAVAIQKKGLGNLSQDEHG